MIILDNGHGIKTKGKRSPVQPDGSQLFEFEFNRDIVRRIAQRLSGMGWRYYVLVPEIEDVPLSERCRRVNDLHRVYPSSFLVSVHANAGGGTGWEVFTSRGQTESDKLADIFYKEAQRKLSGFRMRKDTTDGDYDKEAQFYILKHTTCPAVLTENLFMDNPKDLEFIMSESGRKTIAEIHISAILKQMNVGKYLSAKQLIDSY